MRLKKISRQSKKAKVLRTIKYSRRNRRLSNQQDKKINSRRLFNHNFTPKDSQLKITKISSTFGRFQILSQKMMIAVQLLILIKEAMHWLPILIRKNYLIFIQVKQKGNIFFIKVELRRYLSLFPTMFNRIRLLSIHSL